MLSGCLLHAGPGLWQLLRQCGGELYFLMFYLSASLWCCQAMSRFKHVSAPEVRAIGRK